MYVHGILLDYILCMTVASYVYLTASERLIILITRLQLAITIVNDKAFERENFWFTRTFKNAPKICHLLSVRVLLNSFKNVILL